jgi:hypothetical protein
MNLQPAIDEKLWNAAGTIGVFENHAKDRLAASL